MESMERMKLLTREWGCEVRRRPQTRASEEHLRARATQPRNLGSRHALALGVRETAALRFETTLLLSFSHSSGRMQFSGQKTC